MKKRNAVNTILPYLGEHVVTSLDSRSPTVALILAGLEQHSTSMFAEGYWFNTQETTVQPNSDGIIYTPENMLAFYSLCRSLEATVSGTLIRVLGISPKMFAVVLSTSSTSRVFLSTQPLLLRTAWVLSYTPQTSA